MSTSSPQFRVHLAVLGALLAAVLVLGALVIFHLRGSDADARSFPQMTQPPATVAVPAVAFIGDSYSSGAGSSGFNTRFTTLVSAYEGWQQKNLAFGGTGYLRSETANRKTGCGQRVCPNYQSVIDTAQQTDPNIVVVSGGRNDVGLPQGEVDAAINQFYTRLREALPDARIVVTSPMWAYDQPPTQLAQITTAVQAAASRVDATYLSLGEPLVQDRSLVSSDRIHPNDAGHAEIARLIEVALSESAATPSTAAEGSETEPSPSSTQIGG